MDQNPLIKINASDLPLCNKIDTSIQKKKKTSKKIPKNKLITLESTQPLNPHPQSPIPSTHTHNHYHGSLKLNRKTKKKKKNQQPTGHIADTNLPTGHNTKTNLAEVRVERESCELERVDLMK